MRAALVMLALVAAPVVASAQAAPDTIPPAPQEIAII